MTDPWTAPPGSDRELVEIDHSVAHVARVYDYMLGGTDNFAVDREAADQAAAVYVGGWDSLRASVRANRAFLGRAVHYLAADAGMRQFLDIGSGIPTEDNVHEVAQRAASSSRIVYVDYDPIVLAHSHTLLKSTAQGATAFVTGDLRDPEDVMSRAAATLDFTRPVALVLVAILHVIRDDENPYGIVARLLDAVPSGSYLAIAHLTGDINPDEMAQVSERLNAAMREPFVLRTHAEVSRFFDGLELVDPGVVQVDQWPKTTPIPPGQRVVDIYGAIGRKP